jgi:hypothetical protein
MGLPPIETAATDRNPPEVVPRSLLSHVALLLGLALAAAVALSGVVWFGLGRPDLSALAPAVSAAAGQPGGAMVRRPLTVAERLDGLKIVLALVAGIGAVVALTIAYRKQRHGEIAAYRDKRSEAREITKAFTERYGKAADLLGGNTAAVRLAGVYALAALADDWDDGRQMCVDLLCAYLRMPYSPDPQSDGYLVGNREVRRSLLRVIRNHLRPGWTDVSWGQCGFSFEGATFDCGDLSKICLDIDPNATHDRRPNMTFHGAQFIAGSFDLSGVEFAGAPVWFTKAQFLGGSVRFDGARFIGSDVYFDRAEFNGADVSFGSATWSAGAVTFTDAKHTGGTVGWGPFAPLPLDSGGSPSA